MFAHRMNAVEIPVQASSALKEWINEKLDERGLSMREASIRAGLSAGRLSQIMRGDPPGIEVCIALAQFFGTTLIHILSLAGYIDYDPAARGRPEWDALGHRLVRADDETYRGILQVVNIMLETKGL